MKALSLSRPWTELIVGGVKDIENRSWSTPYRGWLIVHAAKSYDPAALEVLGELGHEGHLTPEDYAAVDGCALHPDAPTGYVGVVRVTDCHKAGDLTCRDDTIDVDWCSPWGFDGSWHWRVTDAHRFATPISGNGRLGLFTPPDDVSDAIQRVCPGILRA